MNKEHPKWNFKEFSAFLMLYAASADLKVTEDEKAAILEKVNVKTFELIKKEYDSLSDYEKIQLVLSYKGIYFPTVARRNEMLDIILKEFNVDGEYSSLEQNLMMFLKKLL